MRRFLPLVSAALVSTSFTLVAPRARAGGGPMNVMVVYSSDDAEATKVAKHYEAARSLPVGHLCGLPGITPAMTTIDAATFKTLIQAPVDACLAKLPQKDEIDDLVLVRGLPYSVTLPAYAASLEAVLQVGHTTDLGGQELAGQGQPMNTQASVQNPYFPAGSVFWNAGLSPVMNQYSGWYALSDWIIELGYALPPSFRRAEPQKMGNYKTEGNVFIVQALDGFDYKDATDLVDRAVASDGTFPKAEILCMHAEDDARGARDPECEYTTRKLKGEGYNGVFVDTFDGGLKGHDVIAYFTGSSDSVKNAIAGNTFAPGAITDNLTSFGAAIQNFSCNMDGSMCPASEAQTSIARFVRAGATGAHGTVNEPLNNVFVNAGALALYTFGYAMGESYFFSQRYLYWQNIHLGDPLATPFAKRPVVTIEGDTAHLAAKATHDAGIARIDLYVAGKRVGQAMSDSVSVAMPGKEGDVLDVLAVAIAKNAVQPRKTWAEQMPVPKIDTQGWKAMKLTLAPPMTSSSSGAGGASASSSSSSGMSSSAGGGMLGDVEPQKSSGCGCRVAGSDDRDDAVKVFLSLLAIALISKRRSVRVVERAVSVDELVQDD